MKKASLLNTAKHSRGKGIDPASLYQWSKHISDRTTHIAEAMVVVVRFVDDQWQLKQCVARLMLLAKSCTGEEVANQLIVCLFTKLRRSATMRDRATCSTLHAFHCFS